MESPITYSVPPIKERFLSPAWLFFFILTSCLSIFLMINGLFADEGAGVFLFFGGFGVLFFSYFYMVRNNNYRKKYKYERTYTYDDTGITVAYAGKKDVYPWDAIDSWIESRKVDALAYEKAPRSRRPEDRLLQKAIANFGKQYLETPNWIDLTLHNHKTIVLEVPGEHFQQVTALLKRKPERL